MGRRLVAEFTGIGLLGAVVVGSGIAAARLTADGALRLLASSLVAAVGLAVLILVFIQVGGAIGTLLAVTLYPVRCGRVQAEQPAQLAG